MIQAMVDKGLTAQDIADIAKAGEAKTDRTAAERQARYRANKTGGKRNAVTLRCDPPIDNTHTPSVSPNGEPQSAKRDTFPKPDCVDAVVWADFLANRKRKRLPNTVTAHKGLLDDLARIADDEWPPGRLIAHAAAKGWGGIYDPRQTGKPKNDQPASNCDEPQNPYVRAVVKRQTDRAGVGF